jgi:hypothetical protein
MSTGVSAERLLRWLVSALGVTLVANANLAGATATRSQPSARIPFLAPVPPRSVERDMPESVQARIASEQRALAERARAASKLSRTPTAGCEPTQIGAEKYFGPPAPKVRARMIGHHVEIVFEFKRLPSSDACRPFEVVTVVNGVRVTTPGPGAIDHYRVKSTRARVASDLPWYAKPPYRLSVSSATILGFRSRMVELSLSCPGTGQRVKGCIRGYAPPLHSAPIPQPVFPLRGIDRSSLEASLRYVIADERAARPAAAHCLSLRSCEITYVDPDFPNSPYRIGYRIVGEQLSGCWMGWKTRRDEPPYEDAWQGRQQLAGCLSWLR